MTAPRHVVDGGWRTLREHQLVDGRCPVCDVRYPVPALGWRAPS